MYILKKEFRGKPEIKLPLMILEKDLPKIPKCNLKYYEALIL